MQRGLGLVALLAPFRASRQRDLKLFLLLLHFKHFGLSLHPFQDLATELWCQQLVAVIASLELSTGIDWVQ